MKIEPIVFGPKIDPDTNLPVFRSPNYGEYFAWFGSDGKLDGIQRSHFNALDRKYSILDLVRGGRE
jgi:hypothetical protein